MRQDFLSFALTLVSITGRLVIGTPVMRDAVIDDSVVLNYALTLEHLENAFYSGALAKFDEAAFKRAGLPAYARGRFQEIAAHEQAHVNLLSEALGSLATSPCTYNFSYTDVKSFAAFSELLEGVGVSAYIGAAQSITNKAYLTVAASILSTEARHASWVAAAVNKFGGWSGAFDVPLDFNQVYSIAASVIAACPSTNPVLPVRAFPNLTLSNIKPGGNADIKIENLVANGSSVDPTFVVFLTGLEKIFVPVHDGKVIVPAGLSGQVYVVATNSSTDANDSTILAGPAILEFERDSHGHMAN
ncbi:Protein rds1 [Psilocybe cubensis]|uniref:Protein rds1 n=1 Tax=Psilocybe cubensis TaxID=181762 RepID=A0ACB8HB65_PSICU|nr:Protein rds1 [Psilocybe cubensis]KAH9484919.1 Protein rds1 [Psilocybe cubensis]